MKVSPTSSDVRRVIAALRVGRDGATSRAQLAAAVGMDDRRVRACIEAARRNGTFIVSGAKGYYLTTAPDEIERQYRIDRARALAILARLVPMRRYLRAMGRDVP